MSPATRSDLKGQLDVSMQSGELLVDLMKLQNILNFEFQKTLKLGSNTVDGRKQQVEDDIYPKGKCSPPFPL